MTDIDFTEQEASEAQRLADALDAVGSGRPFNLDAREDAALISLVETAALLRDRWDRAADTPSFHSYRARSRGYVLHTLEQQHRPTAPVAMPTHHDDRTIVPFVRRHRWSLTAPLAAAAAAAAIFLFSIPASAPDAPPHVASNQTAINTDLELQRIQQALAAIAARQAQGQTVDSTLFRTITEATSALANRIEASPQGLSRDHVSTYQRAVAESTNVLEQARPAAGSESALAAAQRATQDGVVTAARYLGATGTPTPTATPAAPAATATPAANPTSTREDTVRP